MSESRIEFPQSRAGARETRADGADRDTQRERCILVAELRPGAEREDILLMRRKALDERKNPFHLTHVVDPCIGELVEARLRGLPRHTPQRRGEPPLGAASVPESRSSRSRTARAAPCPATAPCRGAATPPGTRPRADPQQPTSRRSCESSSCRSPSRAARTAARMHPCHRRVNVTREPSREPPSLAYVRSPHPSSRRCPCANSRTLLRSTGAWPARRVLDLLSNAKPNLDRDVVWSGASRHERAREARL